MDFREKYGKQGYILTSYGKMKYLRHAVACAITLRRYDRTRPIAIVCTAEHLQVVESNEVLKDLFTVRHLLLPEFASIIGFKHNVHRFLFFEENLFIDSDIIWCKNPDSLWQALAPYPFTTTGVMSADHFFGASKGIGVLSDILLRKRQRTLKRFGLSYLSRVHSGVMYARDYAVTEQVVDLAQEMVRQVERTHFQSRLQETGRNLESCEWSLAMAMSKLNLPVYPWLLGQRSIQLDYISDYTINNADFTEVKCLYYTDRTVYSFRGLKVKWLRRLLTQCFSAIPGRGEYMYVTPYCLHFGWLHEKLPYLIFADRVYAELTQEKDLD